MLNKNLTTYSYIIGIFIVIQIFKLLQEQELLFLLYNHINNEV